MIWFLIYSALFFIFRISSRSNTYIEYYSPARLSGLTKLARIFWNLIEISWLSDPPARIRQIRVVVEFARLTSLCILTSSKDTRRLRMCNVFLNRSQSFKEPYRRHFRRCSMWPARTTTDAHLWVHYCSNNALKGIWYLIQTERSRKLAEHFMHS